jgi:hypothetical protein
VHRGAYVGAAAFDATGSYDRAFWAMLVLSLVAAGLGLAVSATRPGTATTGRAA